MSFYNVKHLDTLLSLWEDHNLQARQNERFYNILRKNGRNDDLLKKAFTLKGSELNLFGELGTSIEKYTSLRKVLGGARNYHPTNFLPRVPFNVRERFSSPISLVENVGDAIIQIPDFLLNWNKTRKACIIDDSIPIPLVDLREEYWLDKLPYSSFYLRISSPLIFTAEKYDNEETAIQNFLIHEEGDYIKILAWNEDLEKHLSSEQEQEERKKKTDKLERDNDIQSYYKYLDPIINKATFAQVYYMSLKKGSTECRGQIGGDISELLDGTLSPRDVDFYNVPDGIEGLVPDYQRIRLYELLNGFCKLMATLPLQTKNEVEVIETIPAPQRPTERHIWTELPLSYAHMYVTAMREKIIVIRRGMGGEIGFHYRSGHTRRYLQKDGTIKEIWFPMTKVRPDKEEEQGGIPVGNAKRIIT